MKIARMKPEALDRVISEIAELTGYSNLDFNSCSKEIEILESQATKGETITAEVSSSGINWGFVDADITDFDFEEIED